MRTVYNLNIIFKFCIKLNKYAVKLLVHFLFHKVSEKLKGRMLLFWGTAYFSFIENEKTLIF